MNGDDAVRIYQVLWSVLAICGGLFLLFRSRRFIEANARAFEKLYLQTGLHPFGVQSREMQKVLYGYVGATAWSRVYRRRNTHTIRSSERLVFLLTRACTHKSGTLMDLAMSAFTLGS
jgi:hypothetical protein